MSAEKIGRPSEGAAEGGVGGIPPAEPGQSGLDVFKQTPPVGKCLCRLASRFSAQKWDFLSLSRESGRWKQAFLMCTALYCRKWHYDGIAWGCQVKKKKTSWADDYVIDWRNVRTLGDLRRLLEVVQLPFEDHPYLNAIKNLVRLEGESPPFDFEEYRRKNEVFNARMNAIVLFLIIVLGGLYLWYRYVYLW